MDITLALAGALSVGLAFGHATIGMRWILPGLDRLELPATPFGPGAMTRSMVRIAWYIVTLFAMMVGGLLLTLAWTSSGDTETLFLRYLGTMWFAAALMAMTQSSFSRRTLRDLSRLPVPVIWVVIGILCWVAS